MDPIQYIIIGIIIGALAVSVFFLLLPKWRQPIQQVDETEPAYGGSVSTPLQVQQANDRAIRNTELSARELQIALLAARGFTKAKIGYELGITARTVDGHLQRIYPKLGVNNRVTLARKLRDMGYKDVDDTT